MRIKIIVVLSVLVVCVAVAGPLNMRNEKALKEHQTKKVYQSSTNYYSADQFFFDMMAAKSFEELKAALEKKAKTDAVFEKLKKDANVKGE